MTLLKKWYKRFYLVKADSGDARIMECVEYAGKAEFESARRIIELFLLSCNKKTDFSCMILWFFGQLVKTYDGDRMVVFAFSFPLNLV
jgi:hypothetical protein